MSRSITATFYPLMERSCRQNKQNINYESPLRQKKASNQENRKLGNKTFMQPIQCNQKETVNKTVLGENHQQFMLNNSTSLSYIESAKNSPIKRLPSLCVEKQNYLQNLKPMRDVNTSIDEQLDQDSAQCEQCDAFHC